MLVGEEGLEPSRDISHKILFVCGSRLCACALAKFEYIGGQGGT